MIPNATELTDWMKHAEGMLKTEDNEQRYNWQFPMGVFGTLRAKCSNNPLMHRSGKPYKSVRAFLPHYNAEGLRIAYEEGSSAPFEIFVYEPDEWDKMIKRVDALESFSPKMYDPAKMNWDYSYYFRTLATLRLLPDEYEHKLFPRDKEPDIWGYRNLEIPPAEFVNYQPIACWIYSSLKQNAKLLAKPELPANPILWPTR